MIQIKFHNYPDGRMELRVSGHAGSAPKGEDLVCAAVSILVYTAATCLQEAWLRGKLQVQPEILLQEGFARIRVKPMAHHRAAAQQIFSVVRCGMEILAGSFPHHVRVAGVKR